MKKKKTRKKARSFVAHTLEMNSLNPDEVNFFKKVSQKSTLLFRNTLAVNVLIFRQEKFIIFILLSYIIIKILLSI